MPEQGAFNANRATELDLHIDRSKSSVGDGAADSTSEGESGVESKAAELLRSSGGGRFSFSGHYII